MNKKKKEDKQYKFFTDAFHEVVIPVLEDMEERMATKEDLKNMATKEDLEKVREEMATKEDIQGLKRPRFPKSKIILLKKASTVGIKD